MSKTKTSESDFDYLKRTIGPGTWVYEILQDGNGQMKTWDLLLQELEHCQTNEVKKRAVLAAFRARSNPNH